MGCGGIGPYGGGLRIGAGVHLCQSRSLGRNAEIAVKNGKYSGKRYLIELVAIV